MEKIEKMNVTLILGNGFDLNMGLPTAYSDFYKYYMRVDSPKTTQLIKQEISDKPQTWADLEKSMGEISKKYGQDSDAYIEAFENVRDELAKYLSAVDGYDITNMDELSLHFYRDVLDIDRFLDNKPKQEYRQFLQGVNSPNEVNLTIVNFNYTSTIEKLMAMRTEFAMPNKKLDCKEIIHVHQDLNTGILMGVNDVSQISNEAYGNEFDIRSMMVKPFINEMFAAGNDNRAKKVIENSQVIILFGTSFGETDEMWWDWIKTYMYGNNKRIIYCPYENEGIRPSHETNVIRKIHYSKMGLAQRLGGNNHQVINDLYNKIYPIRNNHLFEFRFTPRQRKMVREDIINGLMAEAVPLA